jgi:hypothetical protein
MAAKDGHLEVVDRLLRAAAEANAAAALVGSRTALQAAADGGHLEVVERLRIAAATSLEIFEVILRNFASR